MKYIIFECEANARQRVMVFDEITDHSQIAREVKSESPGFSVLSAGKCYFNFHNNVEAANGSVTLNLKYSPERSQEDKELIQKFIDFKI